MRALLVLSIVTCGAPDGRARDPHPAVMLPDLDTGSSGEAADPGRLDLPRWPDLPGASGSSGEGSTGSTGADETMGAPGSTSGEGSTGDATGDASTGESSTTAADTSSGSSGEGSSSTGGPPPSGCPCAPGIDNFCDLAPGTCPPTAPGGYCDPDGNGDYLDGDWTTGFYAWKAECG